MFDSDLGLYWVLSREWGRVGRIWDEFHDCEFVSCTTYGERRCERLIDDSGVHLYFVLCQLREALDGAQTFPSSCPQCRSRSGTLAFKIGGFEFGKSYSFGSGANRGSKNGYAPLLDGEGEPSASTEEQTNGGESTV